MLNECRLGIRPVYYITPKKIPTPAHGVYLARGIIELILLDLGWRQSESAAIHGELFHEAGGRLLY